MKFKILGYYKKNVKNYPFFHDNSHVGREWLYQMIVRPSKPSAYKMIMYSGLTPSLEAGHKIENNAKVSTEKFKMKQMSQIKSEHRNISIELSWSKQLEN